MGSELQSAFPWLQSNITHFHKFRVIERVAMVTELQNALPWLQRNKMRCYG